MGKGVRAIDGKTYNSLQCWVARRTFMVYETLEDTMKQRITLQHRARTYGEAKGDEKRRDKTTTALEPGFSGGDDEKSRNKTLKLVESSLGKSEISFLELVKRRKQDEYKLFKYVKYLAQACPLHDYLTNHLNLGTKFWSFLISRCSPFKYMTVGHLISHLGEHYGNKEKKTGKHKRKDGKTLVKFRLALKMNKTEPYQTLMKNLLPKIKKKNPDFTESHVKNLAWYKTCFDNIIIPYYKKAQVTCSRCPQREGNEGTRR